MRGVQATYRITDSSSTLVAQPVLATDDIIYVVDAKKLSEPNVTNNIWGIITINGERIMYRERDTANNTVSSLLRGTAGTGAADHDVDAPVYDMGRGNLLETRYQDYIDKFTQLADGETAAFTATGLGVGYQNVQQYDETLFDVGSTSEEPGSYDYGAGYITYENVDGITTPPEDFLEVFVGGIRQFTGFSINFAENPIVTFEPPPPAGQDVTVVSHHGETWYAPGAGTPSNGVPLQETNTPAARFLRGIS